MDAASEAEWSALTYAHHRTAASAAAPGATFIGRMDNLAQTLVGAALGRAVADRKVPGAALLGALAEMAALSALAGLVLHWHARRTGTRPAPWRWVAALVVATVAGHLWLDWQGSYGVRPLLPWNTRWYSADWSAIVDP